MIEEVSQYGRQVFALIRFCSSLTTGRTLRAQPANVGGGDPETKGAHGTCRTKASPCRDAPVAAQNTYCTTADSNSSWIYSIMAKLTAAITSNSTFRKPSHKSQTAFAKSNLDEKTDYSRWRLLDERGRQTWHYLEDDEQAKEWPQSVADKYHLGMSIVSNLPLWLNININSS